MLKEVNPAPNPKPSKKVEVPQGAFRYSPEPVEFYNVQINDTVVGPSKSMFFNSSFECWNLAYLSHDFEAEPLHPNPAFSGACRATMQYFLDQGTVDLIGNAPAHMKIQGLLRLPPEKFLQALTRHPGHKKTALYHLLGANWIGIMRARLARCAKDPVQVLLDSMDVEPADYQLARDVIASF